MDNRRATAAVAVVMGSHSDWSTMQNAVELLAELQITCHAEVISAHRTPDRLMQFAEEAVTRGYQIIIAGAGGAAHLPGMLASKTVLPVLGVPIQSSVLNGVDSLYSIVQMPKGIPVGTLAIGPVGAANAALLAAQILALQDATLHKRLVAWRQAQTAKILLNADPQAKV